MYNVLGLLKQLKYQNDTQQFGFKNSSFNVLD